MTYFGFLLLFLSGPLVVLGILEYLNYRQALPIGFRNWLPRTALLAHIVVALVYTTPWDNYLVANRVWWYDPNLVTGIVLGWVPIEEYAFFILQTLLTGLWVLWLIRNVTHPSRGFVVNTSIRLGSTVVIGLLWVATLVMWLINWLPGTYLALELLWALPPIMLQLAFGADILWHYRRLMFFSVSVPTIYLVIADAIAINSGTWTINPALSLQIYLGGVLPIEELIFFLLTNILVAFGMTLVMATVSQTRLDQLMERHRRKLINGGV